MAVFEMVDAQSKAICLVPARSGSKRVANKNVMEINGHPLLAYTISAAIDSGEFDSVVVSTDSESYVDIARHYGADVPFLRPSEFSTDYSPDIEWVAYTLAELKSNGQEFDRFSILRPTSPFRTVATIRRAMAQFSDSKDADSLRAVELCTQHPAKMWQIVDDLLVPVMPGKTGNHEWYSMPTQSLPTVWVQNASLEIAHTRCVTEQNSISGKKIIAFKTNYPEGLDINSESDVLIVKSVVEKSPHFLPDISAKPYVQRLRNSSSKGN